jgi:hypothetical protein
MPGSAMDSNGFDFQLKQSILTYSISPFGFMPSIAASGMCCDL